MLVSCGVCHQMSGLGKNTSGDMSKMSKVKPWKNSAEWLMALCTYLDKVRGSEQSPIEEAE